MMCTAAMFWCLCRQKMDRATGRSDGLAVSPDAAMATSSMSGELQRLHFCHVCRSYCVVNSEGKYKKNLSLFIPLVISFSPLSLQSSFFEREIFHNFLRGLFSVIVSVTIAFLRILSSSVIVPYSSLSPNSPG